MLNRAGSTKNIVGFAAKADKKERHRVRQLTPEEIAELQARLSSDPARVSTRPISVHFHRRPDRCPILIPNPTFPCTFAAAGSLQPLRHGPQRHD